MLQKSILCQQEIPLQQLDKPDNLRFLSSLASKAAAFWKIFVALARRGFKFLDKIISLDFFEDPQTMLRLQVALSVIASVCFVVLMIAQIGPANTDLACYLGLISSLIARNVVFNVRLTSAYKKKRATQKLVKGLEDFVKSKSENLNSDPGKQAIFRASKAVIIATQQSFADDYVTTNEAVNPEGILEEVCANLRAYLCSTGGESEETAKGRKLYSAFLKVKWSIGDQKDLDEKNSIKEDGFDDWYQGIEKELETQQTVAGKENILNRHRELGESCVEGDSFNDTQTKQRFKAKYVRVLRYVSFMEDFCQFSRLSNGKEGQPKEDTDAANTFELTICMVMLLVSVGCFVKDTIMNNLYAHAGAMLLSTHHNLAVLTLGASIPAFVSGFLVVYTVLSIITDFWFLRTADFPHKNFWEVSVDYFPKGKPWTEKLRDLIYTRGEGLSDWLKRMSGYLRLILTVAMYAIVFYNNEMLGGPLLTTLVILCSSIKQTITTGNAIYAPHECWSERPQSGSVSTEEPLPVSVWELVKLGLGYSLSLLIQLIQVYTYAKVAWTSVQYIEALKLIAIPKAALLFYPLLTTYTVLCAISVLFQTPDFCNQMLQKIYGKETFPEKLLRFIDGNPTEVSTPSEKLWYQRILTAEQGEADGLEFPMVLLATLFGMVLAGTAYLSVAKVDTLFALLGGDLSSVTSLLAWANSHLLVASGLCLGAIGVYLVAYDYWGSKQRFDETAESRLTFDQVIDLVFIVVMASFLHACWLNPIMCPQVLASALPWITGLMIVFSGIVIGKVGQKVEEAAAAPASNLASATASSSTLEEPTFVASPLEGSGKVVTESLRCKKGLGY
jgi:hypothetical protein